MVRKKCGPKFSEKGLPFALPTDELNELIEAYGHFETRSGALDELEPGSYVKMLVRKANAREEAAQRELSEIFWNWRDVRQDVAEIDAALKTMGTEEETRAIRNKLFRLSAMALRSLGRAPVSGRSFENFVGDRSGAKMRDAKTEEAEQRKSILRASGLDIEGIASSRKWADAEQARFAELCKASQLRPVSGKTIQRYALGILEDRRKSSGHS